MQSDVSASEVAESARTINTPRMATDSLVFCHSEEMEEEGGNSRKGHPRIVTPSRMEENLMKIEDGERVLI